MNNQTWTAIVEQDPESGDLVLPLNSEILKEVGWHEGDIIEWIDNKDGSWSLVKSSNKTDK